MELMCIHFMLSTLQCPPPSPSTPREKYCIANLVSVVSFNISSWLLRFDFCFSSSSSFRKCVWEWVWVVFPIFMKIKIMPDYFAYPTDVIHCMSVFIFYDSDKWADTKSLERIKNVINKFLIWLPFPFDSIRFDYCYLVLFFFSCQMQAKQCHLYRVYYS